MSTLGYLLLLLATYRFGQIGFQPLLHEMQDSWIYLLFRNFAEKRKHRRCYQLYLRDCQQEQRRCPSFLPEWEVVGKPNHLHFVKRK